MNIKPFTVIMLIYATLFSQISCQTQEIFIDYGGGEGTSLLKFFHDVNDGFYVDIGAFDPIYASNTLNLANIGWNGISIDASPTRLSTFFAMRPW